MDWGESMDQISQVKRQFSIEQWKKYITECQASGMSVRSWCKQNNLFEQTNLHYLLYMPDTDWRNHPEDLDRFMLGLR